VNGYRVSSNQNRLCIGFGRSETGCTPTKNDFIGLLDKLRVSEVDCSQIGMATMLKTTPSDSVVDRLIVDLPPDDCSRLTETAVVHQDIFSNAFADEWMEPEPESQSHSEIIDPVLEVCDFSADSIIVSTLGNSSGRHWLMWSPSVRVSQRIFHCES
jgi:hypothetical protein